MEVVTTVREIIPNPDGSITEHVVDGFKNVVAASGAGEVGKCPVCGSKMYGHFEVMPEGSRWCSSCGYMWPLSALAEFSKGCAEAVSLTE